MVAIAAYLLELHVSATVHVMCVCNLYIIPANQVSANDVIELEIGLDHCLDAEYLEIRPRTSAVSVFKPSRM